MAELMKRIAELRTIRFRMMTGKFDPEIFPAAIDWLDGTIAEHERDMDELLRNRAA